MKRFLSTVCLAMLSFIVLVGECQAQEVPSWCGANDGWNDGKREVVRDILESYGGDQKRIQKISGAATYALLSLAVYETSLEAAPSRDTASAERRALEAADTMGFTVGPSPRGERSVLEYVADVLKQGETFWLVGDVYASLFEHSSGQVVLAYRGSQTGGDWVTNLLGTATNDAKWYGQIEAAIDIAEQVSSEHPNVIFTGHSLGGRLAQVASHKTGRPSIVFNSAPLSKQDIKGSKLGSLKESVVSSFRSPQDIVSELSVPNITAFARPDIVVSNFVEVPAIAKYLLINIFRDYSVIRDYTHSMSALYNSMQAVKTAYDCGWIEAYQDEQLSNLESVDSQWTAGIVPDENISIGYDPCQNESNSWVCLQKLGLSDEAIRFAIAVGGNWVGSTFPYKFIATGAVDVAHLQFNGASTHVSSALLNGSPDIQYLATSSDLSAAFKDPASQQMLARYPKAISRQGQVRSHRLMPDGTQRFTFAEVIVDGCRGCPKLGTAITFIEVGPSTHGAFRHRPIGLLLGSPKDEEESTEATLLKEPQSLQLMLNSLGYDAGEIDGYPGPQTRTALMEFQVEHCLSPTGQPDSKTRVALAVATGFDSPCADKRPPSGITAINPLEVGVYVTDPKMCSNRDLHQEIVWDDMVLVRPGEFVFGNHVNCRTQRTDIRDGITKFRGICHEEVTGTAAEWRFDIETNKAFTEILSPIEGRSSQTFSKCSDDSQLTRGWAAWLPDEAPERQACTKTTVRLSADQIHDAWVGGELYGQTSSGSTWQLEIDSGSDGNFASFTNGVGQKTSGHWQFQGSKFCQSYNEGQSWVCHQVSRCDVSQPNRYVMTDDAGIVTSTVVLNDPIQTSDEANSNNFDGAGELGSDRDLFNIYEGLTARFCYARACTYYPADTEPCETTCELRGMDDTYVATRVTPSVGSFMKATSIVQIFIQQGNARGHPFQAKIIKDLETYETFHVARKKCSSEDCPEALVLIKSEYEGFFADMPAGAASRLLDAAVDEVAKKSAKVEPPAASDGNYEAERDTELRNATANANDQPAEISIFGIEIGNYAANPNMCENNGQSAGEFWGTKFKPVTKNETAFGAEAECEILDVAVTSDGITQIARKCSVEGEASLGIETWKIHSPTSFSLVRPKLDEIVLSKCDSAPQTALATNPQAPMANHSGSPNLKNMSGDPDLDQFLKDALPRWLEPSFVESKAFPGDNGGRLSVAGLLKLKQPMVEPVPGLNSLINEALAQGISNSAFLFRAMQQKHKFSPERTLKEYRVVLGVGSEVSFSAELPYIETVRSKKISGALEFDLGPGVPLASLDENSYVAGSGKMKALVVNSKPEALSIQHDVAAVAKSFEERFHRGIILADNRGAPIFDITFRPGVFQNAEGRAQQSEGSSFFNPGDFAIYYSVTAKKEEHQTMGFIEAGSSMNAFAKLSLPLGQSGLAHSDLSLWRSDQDGKGMSGFATRMRWDSDAGGTGAFVENRITSIGNVAWPK